MAKPTATLIIPCLNEAATLGRLLRECREALDSDDSAQWEICVVDNGSKDSSDKIALESGARVHYETRRGYGSAIQSGLLQCRTEWAVFMDADGTYDPQDAVRLRLAAQKRQSDLMMGSRLKGKIAPGAMPPLHQKFGTPTLTHLLNAFHGTEISDCNSGIRCLRTNFFLEIAPSLGDFSGMEFASALIAEASRHGAKIGEMAVNYRKASAPRTPHLRPFRDGLRHLIAILSIFDERAKVEKWTAIILVAAVGLLLKFSDLIPVPGYWYSPSPDHRIQTEALLRGHLQLGDTPFGHLHDWAWANGLQQLWGLGIPLLQLPFVALAHCFGFASFPDRLVFLLMFLSAGYALWKTFTCSSSPKQSLSVSAGLVSFLLFQPMFFLLLWSRFNVYEEVAAYGYLWALLLFSGLWTELNQGLSRRAFWLFCALCGFSSLIRPTLFFVGLVTWLFLIVCRGSKIKRSIWEVTTGFFLFALGPAFHLVTNSWRFGSPFEFGYGGNLSGIPLNDFALRFGSPFQSESFVTAARELLSLLFLPTELTNVNFFQPKTFPLSSTFRFRELYFTNFGLTTFFLVATLWSAGIYLWRQKKLSRSETIAGTWAISISALLFLFYLRSPSITSRYLADFLAPFALTIALGMQGLQRRQFKLRFAFLFSLFVLWAFQIGTSKVVYAHNFALSQGTLWWMKERSFQEVNLPEVYECPSATNATKMPYGIRYNGSGWDYAKSCEVTAFTQLFFESSPCVTLRYLAESPQFDSTAVQVWRDLTPMKKLAEGRFGKEYEATFCKVLPDEEMAYHSISIGWVSREKLSIQPPKVKLLSAKRLNMPNLGTYGLQK